MRARRLPTTLAIAIATHCRRPPTTLARAAALAALLSVLASAPATAAPGVEVVQGESTQTLGESELAQVADVPPTPYALAAGQAPQTLTGTSLRRLLALAGADPGAITAVTATGAEETVAQLLAPDFAEVAPFAEGPALVWIDEQRRTSLLRPASAEAAARLVVSAPEQPLRLTLSGGAAIAVSATADPDRAEPGRTVRLRAFVVGGDAGGAISYRWTFDDGSVGAGREVSHRYATAGVYQAYVTVTAADGAGGTSKPVRVVVGRAAVAAGGGRVTGGVGGSAATPTGGRSTTPRAGAPGAGAPRAGAPGAGAPGAGAPRAAAPSAAGASPSTPAAEVEASPPRHRARAPPRSRAPRPAPAVRTPARRASKRPAPPAAARETVAGELISLDGQPLSAAAVARAAARATTADEPGSAIELPWRELSIALGLVALAGLGALLETVRGTPPPTPLRLTR